jgi:hypothetical protein
VPWYRRLNSLSDIRENSLWGFLQNVVQQQWIVWCHTSKLSSKFNIVEIRSVIRGLEELRYFPFSLAVFGGIRKKWRKAIKQISFSSVLLQC